MIEVLTDAHGLVLGHELARDVFIFPLDHARNAEEIDQHPEAETANRQPVDQLDADAAEVEIVEAKEEPEEVGEERGFFADFIVAQHEGLRIEGKGLKNTLQGIWDGRGFFLNQAALLSTRFNATEKMASVCTYSLRDKFLLGFVTSADA